MAEPETVTKIKTVTLLCFTALKKHRASGWQSLCLPCPQIIDLSLPVRLRLFVMRCIRDSKPFLANASDHKLLEYFGALDR